MRLPLFRRRRLIRRRGVIHLPDCLRDPESILVVSGPGPADVWSALLLCNNLQNHYRSARLTVVCREGDQGLFGLLEWHPELVPYTPGRGGEMRGDSLASLSGAGPDILFYPYDELRKRDSLLLLDAGASVCVSFSGDEVFNLSVRLPRTQPNPGRIHTFCEVLGIPPDREWKPTVPGEYLRDAATLIAPVSGRSIPHIAATAGASRLLTRAREEVPLKLVTITGRESVLSGQPRELEAALVRTAVLVATDEPVLWAEAAFLGARCVGLDERGVFPDWEGVTPAGDLTGFLDEWERAVREGWR